MLSKQKTLSRRQMLNSVPVLNPAVQWKETGDGRLLVSFERHEHGLRRLLLRVFSMPQQSQLMLDETGSAVVRGIDGKTRVEDLIRYVENDLKLSRKEAEVSLLKYMEMLGQRNLLGFEVPPRNQE